MAELSVQGRAEAIDVIARRIEPVLEAHIRGPMTMKGEHLLVTCLCGWQQRVRKLGEGKAQYRGHLAHALAAEIGKEPSDG